MASAPRARLPTGGEVAAQNQGERTFWTNRSQRSSRPWNWPSKRRQRDFFGESKGASWGETTCGGANRKEKLTV